MNVLSLFDGMSCGQIALRRAGIPYAKYFACEIKDIAIRTTQANFPDTIQLGDVTKVKGDDLPKIDLLIGGSPCQDLSSAMKDRVSLEGDQSKLFYEYVRLLKECKPTYFLLENVGLMDSESSFAISEILDCDPVRINSELVSAQMRDRLYWTNIPGDEKTIFGNMRISQPKDRKIKLQDILENGYTDREKARCLLVSDSRPLATPEKMLHRYRDTGFTTLIFNSPTFDLERGVRYMTQTELERCQTVPEGYTKNLTRNQAADLLGDGWTVEVVAHIFKSLLT